MNTGLNYDVKTSSGGKVRSERSAACYGSYVKSGTFNDYKSHIVTIYMSVNQVSRPSPSEGFKIAEMTSSFHESTKCTDEENLKYLDLFKDVFFKYNVEYIESSLAEAYRVFNPGQSISDKGDKYRYIKVTVDLSQFESQVEAKNALFFLRNAYYAHNKYSIKILLHLVKLFPKFDHFLLFQFSEFLHKALNGHTGEYTFFGRGYSTLTFNSIKVNYPLKGGEYWDLFKKHRSPTVDEVRRTHFNIKDFKDDTLTGYFILAKLIGVLYDTNLNYCERDFKLLKNKLLEFCSGFSKDSSKYLKLKKELDEN